MFPEFMEKHNSKVKFNPLTFHGCIFSLPCQPSGASMRIYDLPSHLTSLLLVYLLWDPIENQF